MGSLVPTLLLALPSTHTTFLARLFLACPTVSCQTTGVLHVTGVLNHSHGRGCDSLLDAHALFLQLMLEGPQLA